MAHVQVQTSLQPSERPSPIRIRRERAELEKAQKETPERLVRHARGGLGDRAFIGWMALALTLQFLTSTELLAMAGVFASLVLLSGLSGQISLAHAAFAMSR